ncbi:3-oxo-5-alpha-steroid 4-dehydrogenase (NADP(+)) [Bertholletia excelsa]
MEMAKMADIFVFRQLPDIHIWLMTLFAFVSLGFLGLSEIMGKHLQYSKFWNANNNGSGPKPLQIKLPSKTGMLLLYTPALLDCLASFVIYPDSRLRFLLVKLTLTIHFFKRVLEVLFVHKFSGGMALDSAIIISLAYFSSSACMLYIQHLTEWLAEPSVDLKYPGVLIFLVGISGNFYHHYLLSKLREKGSDKSYKIPKGGLFSLVICPHYLFEILGFIGIFFVSQTLFMFSCVFGIALYLTARSYMTRKWYVAKFENFPREVKALIPYVF